MVAAKKTRTRTRVERSTITHEEKPECPVCSSKTAQHRLKIVGTPGINGLIYFCRTKTGGCGLITNQQELSNKKLHKIDTTLKRERTCNRCYALGISGCKLGFTIDKQTRKPVEPCRKPQTRTDALAMKGTKNNA